MPVRATKGNMFTTNVGSIFEMGGSDFSYRGIEDAFRQMQNQQKKLEEMIAARDKDIQKTIEEENKRIEKEAALEKRLNEQAAKEAEKEQRMIQRMEQTENKVDRVTALTDDFKELLKDQNELAERMNKMESLVYGQYTPTYSTGIRTDSGGGQS